MFSADARIRFIPATREQVETLVPSLNKPCIAVPGKAAQEVLGHVVGVKNANGTLTIFVHLLLTQTREVMVYVDHDNLYLTREAYAGAEAEAIGFCESMGFIVDPVDFRALSPEQQSELMRSTPCFSKDLPPAQGSAADAPAQPDRPESPQLKLARLFAAF